MKVTVRHEAGHDDLVVTDPELSLMEVMVEAGIAGIDAICGGLAMCGTCLVDVGACSDGHFAPPDQLEQELLASMGVDSPSLRLSCQLKPAELGAVADVKVATDLASLA